MIAGCSAAIFLQANATLNSQNKFTARLSTLHVPTGLFP